MGGSFEPHGCIVGVDGGNSDDLVRRAPTILRAQLNIPQPGGLFPASGGHRRTVSFRKPSEFEARTARTRYRDAVTSSVVGT